jgi:hypothetical protein
VREIQLREPVASRRLAISAVFSEGEKLALLEAVERIEKRLHEIFAVRADTRSELPTKVVKAMDARSEANAVGYFTVKTFAAVVGRSPHWVSDRCKPSVRVIKTLPGGKPYRIPLSEEARFNA